MRALLSGAGIVLIVLLFGVSPANSAALDDTHSAWSALLRVHVHWNAQGTASTVDYAGMARQKAALNAYLQQLAAITPAQYATWSKNQRRAFLINAYNAQTVALILTRWPKLESIKDLGGFFSSPWKQRFFSLLQAERSLDEIEHTMLRGASDFDDPRIHFAVNCASIGCPALRPEAYTAAALDAQLEDQARRFLRDRTRNYYDVERGRLTVSKIFDWYAEDFERGLRGITSVSQFLAGYATELSSDPKSLPLIRQGEFELSYADYDWSLNSKR